MSEKTTVMQTAVEQQPTLKIVKPEEMIEHMERLRETIARRAFELFESDGGMTGRDLDHWFRAESELLHPVHVEISESGDAVNVQAEVPGFSSKELEVSLEPSRVTISGKRQSAKENKSKKIIYSEMCSTEIFRSICLSVEIEAAKATATLKDGILSLSVPKAAAAVKSSPATKVQVKAA